MIPLAKPSVGKTESNLVLKVLRSSRLSIGSMLEEFEERVARYLGVRFAVGVHSGTSALHLSMKAINLGPGDEVITTPYSFISSANCVLYERARPVFVDIDPYTFNMDVSRIEKAITKRTKAILPVHVFGHPCEMDSIMAIAEKHGLSVIEDACEALGADYQGQKVGTFGRAGTLAFYPNKQLTCGEGGMIVTNDRSVASLCKSLRNQGRSLNSPWLVHDRLGYNYRLDEVRAAVGVGQMKRIEQILRQREKIARLYNQKLQGIPGIVPSTPYGDVRKSWFVYNIRLSSQRLKKRICEALSKEKIQWASYFPSIHLQPFYKKLFRFKKGDFPVSEEISQSMLTLPFYTDMTESQVSRVCSVLLKQVN